MNFSELQATPSDNFGAAVLHAPLLRRCFQWGVLFQLIICVPLLAALYSSLYGSQLPNAICTLHVRVAQVLKTLEGSCGKSSAPFIFTHPNLSIAELLDR